MMFLSTKRRKTLIVVLSVFFIINDNLEGCKAFQLPIHKSTNTKRVQIKNNDVRTKTLSLNAAVLPTMIISPMIKKMREEKLAKKQPMATRDEAKAEAPGLRIGRNVWKWPPVWPYDDNFFIPNEDVPKPQAAPPSANNLLGTLSGIPQMPTAEELTANAEAEKEDNTLKPLEYWGVEKKDVTTDLDPDAVEKIKSHYGFYLKDGMSVLEFGAAEESYLPDDLKLSRHVGVGAAASLMDKNPRLTEKLVVDLNIVVPDRDVDNDELRALSSEPFDAIIMANTVDFLTHPREVYRSAWYLLKPGGVMINVFSTKEAYKSKFERAQTQMWRSYNDDQHMWICGSFFEFSAGSGWERLLGFDISPATAKEDNDSFFSRFSSGKNNNVYVVQATKAYEETEITKDNLEKSINSKMWMLPKVEPRDKNLVANRLIRAIETSETTNNIEQVVANNIQHLPTIYETLNRMDKFSFTFSMQSQLAADLICDPDFVASDKQIIALKQGLGLRTPSEDFWLPLGTLTADMEIEDKISLLAYIVPRFDSNDPEQEAALDAFVTGLEPMFKLLRSRLPEISEADVQLLGTELLAAEILIPGRSSRTEFASWMDALSNDDLKEFLSVRKQIRIDAKESMFQYQDERAAAQERYKERQKQMKEQIDKARKERSMIYNVRTEKFEVFENKK